jgi:hypothetical protein
MKKLIFVVGATYFVTRHWENMSQRDRNKLKTKTKKLASKTAQVIGRELGELDYRRAWRKLGR